jgi:hypothetical protein
MTATEWRSIPIATLIEKQAGEVTAALKLASLGAKRGRRMGPDLVAPTVLADAVTARNVVEELDGQLEPRVAHYLAVARVYSAAWTARDRSPVRAMVAEFGCARQTAAKWVSIARNGYRFLEKTEERRAGGRLTAKARRLIERATSKGD